MVQNGTLTHAQIQIKQVCSNIKQKQGGGVEGGGMEGWRGEGRGDK